MEPNDSNTNTGKVILPSGKSYYAFEPNHLPFKINYTEDLVNSLHDSLSNLSKLSGMGNKLDNPNLVTVPFMKKEAVLSSKIEGTRTTLSEVFIFETENKKNDPDFQEVENYINALTYGLNEIKNNEISEELIKEMHKILLKGVRGENKNPGKYRTDQNWIGKKGDDVFKARFVPSPPENIPKLMKNLIDYLNKVNTPPLLKIGIAHYQFETIHPFSDGNGRIGRLLIILYLCKSNLLSYPLLYLSDYFAENDEEYKEKLYKVSVKGNLSDWLTFFLLSVKIQSSEAIEIITQLENYKKECMKKFEKETRNTKVFTVLDYLFQKPFLNIPEIKRLLKSEYQTAKRAVLELVKYGILEEVETKQIAQLYRATKIMDILNKV